MAPSLVHLPLTPRRPRLGATPQTRLFFALALPGLIAAGIPQLKLMAGAMVASSSKSGVSWLYYSYRLYELPLGVASIAIASAIVPAIAASIRAANDEAIRRVQSQALEIALGLDSPGCARARAFRLKPSPAHYSNAARSVHAIPRR